MKKVTAYLLNDDHPVGKHKCSFFKSFGFTPGDPGALAAALKEHAIVRPVTESSPTDFGIRYKVECGIRSPDGRDPCIVSLWQLDPNGVPAFLTAYPKKAKG